jgi:hypothetical protein
VPDAAEGILNCNGSLGLKNLSRSTSAGYPAVTVFGDQVDTNEILYPSTYECSLPKCWYCKFTLKHDKHISIWSVSVTVILTLYEAIIKFYNMHKNI